MARGFNKVILIGNLARDPEELILPQSVKKLTKARLAVNDTYSDKVFYFDISFWNPLGDVIMKYTKKGSKILVEGRLIQLRKEQKDQLGNKIVNVRTEIVAENVILLSPKLHEEPRFQEDRNLKTNINTTIQRYKVDDLYSKEVSYQSSIEEITSENSVSEGEMFDDNKPPYDLDVEEKTNYGELDQKEDKMHESHDDIDDINTNKKL